MMSYNTLLRLKYNVWPKKLILVICSITKQVTLIYWLIVFLTSIYILFPCSNIAESY